MKKIKNLCVATSKYTDKEGKERTNWLTVGGLMLMDNGKEKIMLSKTFNPAGVPTKENSDVIFIEAFDVKDKNVEF